MIVPEKYSELEKKMFTDYVINNNETKTKFLEEYKKHEKCNDLDHYFNELHVFCRLADYYEVPKNKAYHYASKMYKRD